jgi:hypothetical protein
MPDDGQKWTEVDDGRMRYEKGGAMSFRGTTLDDACACPRNAFGVKMCACGPHTRKVKARRKHPGHRDF